MRLNELIYVPTPRDIARERVFILAQIEDIGEESLLNLASRAATNIGKGYQPYSNYPVGVALATISGTIFDGANVERVTYSETNHAEESAVTAAVLGGEIKRSSRKFIRALAVAHGGDSAPCGRCRQIISEHCDNALIITATPEGNIRRITSMGLLLPYAFTPTHLGK